jgi:hypothetical protein
MRLSAALCPATSRKLVAPAFRLVAVHLGIVLAHHPLDELLVLRLVGMSRAAARVALQHPTDALGVKAFVFLVGMHRGLLLWFQFVK